MPTTTICGYFRPSPHLDAAAIAVAGEGSARHSVPGVNAENRPNWGGFAGVGGAHGVTRTTTVNDCAPFNLGALPLARYGISGRNARMR
jgi:hypothetical protein